MSNVQVNLTNLISIIFIYIYKKIYLSSYTCNHLKRIHDINSLNNNNIFNKSDEF